MPFNIMTEKQKSDGVPVLRFGMHGVVVLVLVTVEVVEVRVDVLVTVEVVVLVIVLVEVPVVVLVVVSVLVRVVDVLELVSFLWLFPLTTTACLPVGACAWALPLE